MKNLKSKYNNVHIVIINSNTDTALENFCEICKKIITDPIKSDHFISKITNDDLKSVSGIEAVLQKIDTDNFEFVVKEVYVEELCVDGNWDVGINGVIIFQKDVVI